jgi:Ca2+/Na+ antiporter
MDIWVLAIGLMIAYVALMMLHFKRYGEFLLLMLCCMAIVIFYLFIDAEGPREPDPDVLVAQREKWENSEVETR